MDTIHVNQFGSVITDKEVGAKILHLSREKIDADGVVKIDLTGILTMATYCAKQIFGSLYVQLGPEGFFRKVSISNASDDVKALIQMGILSALQETERIKK